MADSSRGADPRQAKLDWTMLIGPLLFAILALSFVSSVNAQRITENLVVLYDFTEGAGNVVHDRGPDLGVAGAPVDLMFDPNELSPDPIAGEFGDRPGLISWGDNWINLNIDHPVDDGTAHGTPDAAVIWDGGPGNSSKLVDRVVATGQFTLEAWLRPASIDNRSNTGRIAWMTVEGTDDASNFALGQQSCCDGGGLPGGIQVRLNTDSPDPATRAILDSDGFLFEEEQLLHIVHTHDASSEETLVYLNIEGVPFDDTPVIDDVVLGDNLEGWDPDYVFALGNDPYRLSRWFGGELHLVAMYDRAFSVDDIRSQFELGPDSAPSLAGDFNGDGVLDGQDVDELSRQSALGSNNVAFDLNDDAIVNDADLSFWIRDLYGSWVGDANLDKEFNSGDLVSVLASGTYEMDVDSVWSTGDFDGDGRSGTADLVAALSDGGYEAGQRPAVAAVVPEPATCGMFAIAILLLNSRLIRPRRS